MKARAGIREDPHAGHGLAVDDDTRTRILACTDGATLDRWVARAVVAPSAADVIAEPAGYGSAGGAR